MADGAHDNRLSCVPQTPYPGPIGQSAARNNGATTRAIASSVSGVAISVLCIVGGVRCRRGTRRQPSRQVPYICRAMLDRRRRMGRCWSSIRRPGQFKRQVIAPLASHIITGLTFGPDRNLIFRSSTRVPVPNGTKAQSSSPVGLVVRPVRLGHCEAADWARFIAVASNHGIDGRRVSAEAGRARSCDQRATHTTQKAVRVFARHGVPLPTAEVCPIKSQQRRRQFPPLTRWECCPGKLTDRPFQTWLPGRAPHLHAQVPTHADQLDPHCRPSDI